MPTSKPLPKVVSINGHKTPTSRLMDDEMADLSLVAVTLNQVKDCLQSACSYEEHIACRDIAVLTLNQQVETLKEVLAGLSDEFGCTSEFSNFV